MTTEIVVYDSWFENLVEELKDLIIETEFTSRWALIEGYHSVGTRILKENDNFERSQMSDFVQCIAKSLNKSERTIYYAVQFAKTYPDLNLLPEGKNCSWFKIVNKYLTTTGEKKPTLSKGELVKQIEEIKKLLENEWYDNNQIVQDVSGMLDKTEARLKCDYIRYLQDQVNKITGDTGGIVI